MILLSLLCVLKSTTAKPSNSHHGSVRRVMFFNGISLSCAAVKCCAGNTYFQSWKTSKEWLGVHKIICCRSDCVEAAHCLQVGIFLEGGAHQQGFSRTQIKKGIGKILVVLVVCLFWFFGLFLFVCFFFFLFFFSDQTHRTKINLEALDDQGWACNPMW